MLKPLQPSDIDNYWPFVLSRKWRGVDEDTLSNLYKLCKSGDAVMFTCIDGFNIAHITQDKSTGRMELFNLLTWGRGEVFSKYLPYLVSLAKALGCSSIGFLSERKGYLRKLGKEWEVTEHENKYRFTMRLGV